MTTINDTDETVKVGTFEASVEASVSPNATTHFADDTLGYIASQPQEVDLISKLVKNNTVDHSQTIIDFLERPNVMTSGSFGATDSGILWSADVTSIIASSLKIARLQGIFTIRSDFEITLQVNAARFQSGRYILGWCPSGGSNGVGSFSGAYNSFFKAHTANLQVLTQLPHVEIDLAKQTHVTLRIPYMSQYTHNVIGTTGTYHGMGKVFIAPYVALGVGSGDTIAYYTVWGSLKNIDLGAPTVNQMAPPKGKSIIDKEQDAMNVGPISGALARVSKATEIVGQIPIIGPYATSVSWVSKILSNAADAMGWSKPIMLSPPMRTTRNVLPFFATSDVVSTAQPLGLRSDNQVIQHTGVGRSGEDQMSFDYIKKQKAWFTTITWDASKNAGTQLLLTGVNPSVWNLSYGKGTTYPPIGWMAKDFSQWRGGVKFTFKLVKTEFHTGRLSVAFQPSYYSIGAATFTATEYLFREVVDVRTTSEFEVCVPYLSPDLYLPVYNAGSVGISGTLLVHVVDALVVPSSVPSTVSIIVEVSGDDDLQFAYPTFPDLEVYIPAVTQMADPYVSTPCFKLGAPSQDLVDAASVAAGEKIVSYRQFLKKFNNYVPAGSQGTVPAKNNITFGAYLIPYTDQAATNADPIRRDSMWADFYARLAMCYVFATGSVRFTLSPYGATGDDLYQTEIYSGGNVVSVGSTAAPLTRSGIRLLTPSQQEGLIDVQLPTYNRMLARATPYHMVNSTNGVFPVFTVANPTVLAVGNYFSGRSTTTTYVVSRTGGDDLHFSGWVGTVPLIPAGTA
jgi:hypothetical protein